MLKMEKGCRSLLIRVRIKTKPSQPFCFYNQETLPGGLDEDQKYLLRISCFKHKFPVSFPCWLQQIKTHHLSLTTRVNNKLAQNLTDLETRKLICQGFCNMEDHRL